MNLFRNIWNQPKTSAAGLLIAVVSIAGVLSQQGISLGKAGTGTVVSLVTALATALLGLLAKDPEAASGQSTRQSGAPNTSVKLGVWMLIALLVPLPWMQGCSGVTVAQDIVNWTPALQSAVATVDSTASLLAPPDAPIFSAATYGFDAASNLLVAQAKAYLANPSASALQTLQTQVSAALLHAVKIVDPAGQAHALSVLQAVATIVNTIFALVASISSKAAMARMSAATGVKLAMLRPYLDETRAAEMVAAHYNEPLTVARMQVVRAEQMEMNAGF
jgi:hypothetical protein